MIEKKILEKKLSTGDFDDLDRIIQMFEIYYLKLLDWNKKTNLISKNDEKNIVERHFLDSIACLDVCKIPLNSSIIDIGTGAGFPGLPIGIVRDDLKITLVDSKRKKIHFLKDLLFTLKQGNIIVLNERVEKLGERVEYQKKYNFVIARAVARLLKIYEWSRKLLMCDGSILAIKGGDLRDEIEELKKSYKDISVEKIPLNSKLYLNNRDRVIVRIKL